MVHFVDQTVFAHINKHFFMAKTRKATRVDPDELMEVVTVESPRKTAEKVVKPRKKAEKKVAQPKKPRKTNSAPAAKLAKKEPSPNRTESSSPEAEPILKKLDVITETDILQAHTTGQLMEFVNSLVHPLGDALLERYKQTTRLQMSTDARLIAELRGKLSTKQETIDALLEQIRRLQNNMDGDIKVASASSSTPRKTAHPVYELPIRKRTSSLMIQADDLEQELKTIGVTLDMLELLTGVRIINYEEDKEKLYFDVKQASTNDDSDVSVEYQLIIEKNFQNAADVNYVPVFLTDKSLERVIKHLPDYLRDNLVFPYNTLLQFYAKMNRALNKSAKT